MRLLRYAIAISLSVSTLLFLFWSRHWPLVGDASLIHYLAYLISRGFAPYRDFIDMDMPGAFLIELSVMKLFGGGAIAWRVFDGLLLGMTAFSFFVLSRRAGWFPAVFAGTLFALIHGRDGLVQSGQRDLIMAVLLVASTACLAIALRRRNFMAIACFGLFAGMALTIKPTALPLSLAQLGIAVYVLRKRRQPWLSWAMAAGAGLLVMPAACLIFLGSRHALPAFRQSLVTMVPYYASLGHRPLSFLLQHAFSPVMPLVVLWLAVVVMVRPKLDAERALLFTGAVFGLVSYLVQSRGFPYHRYPLLAFLLLLMALEFTDAAASIRTTATIHNAGSILAVAGLCVGGLFLGPQSAILTHRYRWWESGFLLSMQQNLERLGGTSLSGQVQCIDSITGCDTVLYRMKLLPASGILLDFPLFGDERNAFVQQSRADFRAAVFDHPPQVIVLTSPLYVNGPDNYRKLAYWPELATFLAQRYTLQTDWHPTRTERWWSREDLPPGYRIYVLRGANPQLR